MKVGNIWWIVVLLAVNKWSQTSAYLSKRIVEDIGTNFLQLRLPSPFSPIKVNIIEILQKLPSLSKLPKLDEGNNENDKNVSNSSVNNEDIAKAVELLRNSINESANPCEDFFEFTCGTWMANHQETTQLTALTEKTKGQMQDLIKDPKRSSSNAINKAKSMFGACKNYDQRKGQKPSILLQKINEFCGWPILRGLEWDEKCFKLPQILAKFRLSLGLSDVLIGPTIELNRFNVSQQAIHFYPTSLGLEKAEKYRDPNELVAYAQRIKAMVNALASDAGISLSDEKINREVNKIVQFESELASFTNDSKLPEMLEPGRFSDLATMLPEVNLADYFKVLLPDGEKLYQNYFASKPKVLSENAFVEHLSAFLQKTNKTTVANYVILRYVMEWSKNFLLDDRLEPSHDRDNGCVEVIKRFLPEVSGVLYVRQYFDTDSKNVVLEMVKDLRNAFGKMLGHVSWMDRVTKKRALSKLDKVIPLIGFPDFMLNDTILDANYEGLKLDANDSYLPMVEKTSKFIMVKEFEKLLKPADRNEFYAKIYEVNAEFEPKRNVIAIPASFLQVPYFHKSFPKAINYGAIGMVIGHELTHGFDDIGAEYDEQGSLRSWWEPETKANFRKQKQCLIDQYSAFLVPEVNMTVNGTLTAQENIADNGGIKEAYMAYQAYLKKLGHREKRLPGFEHFTNEQLFFISNGIMWCAQQSSSWLQLQILKDDHSPKRFRANGVLSNLPEFAAAFNCSKGTLMNPAKKCRMW